MMKKNKISIYIHIPFCESRCHYCDFCSSLLNRENVEVRDGNAISANYLSSIILDMLGYNKVDNFFMYNSELRKELPIISRNFIFDGENTYSRLNVDGKTKDLYEDYKKYEYYRIND